jgi:hypothetical protein
VLGIVNSEIVKVTDESVQKEIDINTEVLGMVNGKVVATYDKALVNNVKAVDQVAYMHTDALGNIVTVTGNNGEIRLRQAVGSVYLRGLFLT